MRFAYRVEAANMAEVERLVKERLRLNFAKDHLAVPRIKIVNNPSSKWLGRTTYRSREPGTSVIEIQKRIINDVDTLTRIIDHELIHHKEFLRVPLDPSQKNEHKNPHDEDFMREARRINMKMGSNWVTKKSDFSYVENSTDKEFYAILYNNKGKIGYATMVRPDTEQKDALEASVSYTHLTLPTNREV